MGSPICGKAWGANVALVALGLGCMAGEPKGPDPETGQPPAAVPAQRRTPANVVTEIEPARIANHRPRFISMAPVTAREGEPYYYGFAALDPDGEELRYVLVRAPEGAAVVGDLLEWTPRHSQTGHPQRFTLRAVDERGAARDQTWSVLPQSETDPRHHRGGHPRF
jgi:hypothetical protein